MQIQSKNTTSTLSNIPLSGNTQMEMRFFFRAVGMESGKRFTVSYNNGVNTTYTTLATFTSASTYSGTNFVTDAGFYRVVVLMNATSFTATSRLRFTINGANTSDQIYIDSVSVIGRTGTTGSGTTVSMTPVTPLKIALMEPLRSNSGKDMSDLALYPNPVDRALSVSAPDRITRVRIYASDGAVVYEVQPNRSYFLIDVGSLLPGWYIAEFISEKGVTRKRFIRQ